MVLERFVSSEATFKVRVRGRYRKGDGSGIKPLAPIKWDDVCKYP